MASDGQGFTTVTLQGLLAETPVEKNHEYIRYGSPSREELQPLYTQEDIILLLNHINSTRRS